MIMVLPDGWNPASPLVVAIAEALDTGECGSWLQGVTDLGFCLALCLLDNDNVEHRVAAAEIICEGLMYAARNGHMPGGLDA